MGIEENWNGELLGYVEIEWILLMVGNCARM